MSDLGCVRTKNEDNLICNHYIKDLDEDYCFMSKKMECSDLQLVVYGVFDGMGGYNKGELSSYSVALNAKKLSKRTKGKNIEEKIKQFYMESNEEICDYMKKYNIRTGTTVALMCIYQDNVCFSNLGDSSIFRLRNGKLEDMYEEHTERKLFEILKRDLGKKKYKLTQHLGIFPEEMVIEPYIKSDKLEKEDLYVICSDGLTDMVDRECIEDILKSGLSPKCIVRKLLNEAKEAGGKDNITILCLKA